MIILLAALASETVAKPEPRVEARARIVRGSQISPKNWNPQQKPNQREILLKEKDGRLQIVRLTEYE